MNSALDQALAIVRAAHDRQTTTTPVATDDDATIAGNALFASGSLTVIASHVGDDDSIEVTCRFDYEGAWLDVVLRGKMAWIVLERREITGKLVLRAKLALRLGSDNTWTAMRCIVLD